MAGKQNVFAVKSLSATFLTLLHALIIMTLLCWPLGFKPALAQGSNGSPSLTFRADSLRIEVKQESGPTRNMTVSTVNDQDGALVVSGTLDDSAGILGRASSTSLTFLDEPLALDFKQGDKIPIQVAVRNDSSRSIELKFAAILRDSKGKRHMVSWKQETRVKPFSVALVDLKVGSKKLKGFPSPLKGIFVGSGTESVSNEKLKVPSATLPITLTRTDPRPKLLDEELNLPWFGPSKTLNWILFTPFLISLVIVSITYGMYRVLQGRKEGGGTFVPLLGGMGTGLSLDFSKSWATLFTVAGGLFTTVTGAALFPETRATFTGNEIAVLSLSFGTLLIVAPVLYNSLRWHTPEPLEELPADPTKEPKAPDRPQLGKEPEAEGYIGTLLIASALVSGALTGQLVLAFLLINEIENVDTTTPIRLLLFLLVVGAGLYTLGYTASGVVSSLREKVKWEKKRNEWKTKLDEWRKKKAERDEAARTANAKAAQEEEESLRTIHRDLVEIRKELLNERTTPRRSLRLL